MISSLNSEDKIVNTDFSFDTHTTLGVTFAISVAHGRSEDSVQVHTNIEDRGPTL